MNMRTACFAVAAACLAASIAVAEPVEDGLFTFTILDTEFRTPQRLEAKIGAYGFAVRTGHNLPDGFSKLGYVAIPDGLLTNIAVGNMSKQRYESLVGELDAADMLKVAAEVKYKNSTQYRVIVQSIDVPREVIPVIEAMREADDEFKKIVENEEFRIVTRVALVFGYQEHRDAVSSIAVELERTPIILKNGKLEYKIGNMTFNTLEDGTVLAYVFHRACWENGEIKHLIYDLFWRFKLNRGCPSGTSYLYPGVVTTDDKG